MNINIKRSYIIAGASSIFCNIFILLAFKLLSNKPLLASGKYLSETLLENYNVYTIGTIALCAGVISYLTGVRPFIISLFMVVIFPIVAICEAIAYPTSHNLLPIELIMYFIMGVPPFIGAFFGYKFLNKKEESQQTASEN